MSVSADWKPKRAIRAKIRDNKTIILIGWRPKRVTYAKIKDKLNDKVTASVQTWFARGILAVQEPVIQGICKSAIRNMEFKVVRENRFILFNVPFPFKLPFSNFSMLRGAAPLAGHHPIHKVELVPICSKLSLILLFTICFYFWC